MRLDNWENPCGDVFTIEEFNSMCEDGTLTDGDGNGFYGDGNVFSRENEAYPSLATVVFPRNATHVLWFNV
jgi:hypothetical protein